MRENVENSYYSNILGDLKSMRADKDELLSYVLGLISDSPNAKETILADIEEEFVWSEECCEESGT